MVDPHGVHLYKGAANNQLAPPRRKARAATDYYKNIMVSFFLDRVYVWRFMLINSKNNNNVV